MAFLNPNARAICLISSDSSASTGFGGAPIFRVIPLSSSSIAG